MAGDRDISFATFNLYNLQVPSRPLYHGRTYTHAEYDEKIGWTAQMLRDVDADVFAFQELWSAEALEHAFQKAGLADTYELVLLHPADQGWYGIAVALAVRKPWAVNAKVNHKAMPDGFLLRKLEQATAEELGDEDYEIDVSISKFSRTVIEVEIANTEQPDLPPITVFACHFKSKRPMMLDYQDKDNAHKKALGQALSTIRRTAEAAGVRVLVEQRAKDTHRPVVVLGDLNDGLLSNTTAIISSQPRYRLFADSRVGSSSDAGLYSTSMLQQLHTLRDVYYTHDYQGVRETLDHIFVTEQFYDFSKNRVWTLRENRVWNDHLDDEHKATTDHGIVRAAFDYNKAD